MIKVQQRKYGVGERNYIEFHGREWREYDMRFDRQYNLPEELWIKAGPEYDHNRIGFTGIDMVKLIHGIVDNSNEETCKMLIEILNVQLEKLRGTHD